jgi:hypothetical protein
MIDALQEKYDVAGRAFKVRAPATPEAPPEAEQPAFMWGSDPGLTPV